MDNVQDAACLEKYVGLQGYCSNIPGELILNDLPGIKLRTLASAANEEDKTAIEVFTRCRREAASRVGRDFTYRLFKKYDVADVADRITAGVIDSSNLVTTGTFTIYRRHATLSLELEHMRFWADREGVVTIQVAGYDPMPVTVVKGFNEAYFTHVNGVEKLEVTVTGEAGVQLASSRQSTCGCDPIGMISGRIMAEVTFAARCTDVLCLFARPLAFATRYMTAIHVLEELEYSDRKDYFIRNNRQSAQLIRARILGETNPETMIKESSLYWREISIAVRNARLTGPCVRCTQQNYSEDVP